MIDEIKKLDTEKKDLLKDKKIKFNPDVIKDNIERIEYKIETEAISFDKEKKLMKEINELKKRYRESSDVNDLFDKIDSLDKEIKDFRKKANDSHQKLKEIFIVR